MSKKIAIVYSPEEPKQMEPEFTLVRSPSSPTTRVVQRPRANSRLLISQPEMNHFNNLISEDIFLREEEQVTPFDIINDISEMILSNSEELEEKLILDKTPDNQLMFKLMYQLMFKLMYQLMFHLMYHLMLNKTIKLLI